MEMYLRHSLFRSGLFLVAVFYEKFIGEIDGAHGLHIGECIKKRQYH